MDQIIATNRGAFMLKRAASARLQPRNLRARLEAGVFLVDIRHPRAFGAGHVAGSLNVWIESPQFAERVGWFVPAGRPLVLLAESEGEVTRAVSALSRVGLDDVVGYLVDTGAVPESGLPMAVLPNVTSAELARRRAAEPDLVVLDVREPVEWEHGHVPGARHIPMRQVADRLAELPRDRRIALICRSGLRSSTVGSMLLAHGFTDLINTWGGTTDWVQAGLPVTEG